MAALCTLTEAKTHLNITTSTNDAELTVFLDVASDLVEAQANRVWRDTTYTECHAGGTDTLVLFHSPVLDVTSITDNGTALDSGSWVLHAEFGRIHFPDYCLIGGDSEVVVVYDAGAATVPNLVRQATLETVRHLWQTQRGSMGARNPLSGDDYASPTTFSLPMRAAELLDKLAFRGGIG